MSSDGLLTEFILSPIDYFASGGWGWVGPEKMSRGIFVKEAVTLFEIYFKSKKIGSQVLQIVLF